MVSDNGVNCGCTYNGIKYNRGQTFPQPGDTCGNTCTCPTSGSTQVTCTKNTCCRNPMTNQPMRVGDKYPNECNTCTCMQNGQVQCENKVCFCFGNGGQKYKVGFSWVHTDGCNTCTCTHARNVNAAPTPRSSATTESAPATTWEESYKSAPPSTREMDATPVNAPKTELTAETTRCHANANTKAWN